MRILITRTDRIGDVALSTPVIKAVRDKFPKAHIAFCVQPHAVGIVSGSPYLNEIIIYDKKNEHKGLWGIVGFIFKIMKKRFDIAMILHPTNRMNLTCFLAGIPKRVGYNRKMGFLLTDKMPHTKQEGKKHEVEYTLDVARYMGIEPKGTELYIKVGEDVKKDVEKLFSEYGIAKDHKIIAIHPGASCPSKRWSAKNFSDLADRLVNAYGVKVIVLGGKDDCQYSKRVVEKAKSSLIDLTGKTDISLLAGILSRSSLFVSNDSGPVHIAVSVGTPVIAIFGRRDCGLSPKRWGPRGDHDVVLHKDVGCVVCLAHKCDKGFKCLEAITVDEVIGAVEKFELTRGKSTC